MKRLQRLRKSQNIRDLMSQTEFNTAQLVQPLFIVEGISRDEEIKGLRGVYRNTIESVKKQMAHDLEVGVKNFILFHVPGDKKLKNFKHDFSSKVISSLKKEFGDRATLWIDTCLCSATTHGHCCVFEDSGQSDSEQTLTELALMAKNFADAGADGISPSDMQDGRTAAIREILDKNGHHMIPVMSYSTKFASQFYGPFRGAADSSPKFGDRTQYQIDVRNRSDSIQSSVRCAEEGADLLMVKPGLTSIDLISPITEATGLAVGAYQVSGEYASLALLEKEGLIDFNKALRETWHVFKRAGARYVITYGARYAKDLGVTVL